MPQPIGLFPIEGVGRSCPLLAICPLAKCRRTSSRASLRTGSGAGDGIGSPLRSWHLARPPPAIDADNVALALRKSRSSAALRWSNPIYLRFHRFHVCHHALPVCPVNNFINRRPQEHQRTEHDSANDGTPAQRRQPVNMKRNRSHADDDGSVTPPPKFCNQTATTPPTVICCFGCSIIVGCCIMPPTGATDLLQDPDHNARLPPSP